jgi:hypothetical protein
MALRVFGQATPLLSLVEKAYTEGMFTTTRPGQKRGSRFRPPNPPCTAHAQSQHMIGFAGGLNLYIYGNQNPVRFVDPSGLDIWIHRNVVIGGHQGGYMYGWEWQRYKDARALAPVLQNALPGSIDKMIARGHQSEGGMSLTTEIGGQGGHLITRPDGSVHMVQGRDVDIDLKILSKIGVKSIELRACNSAGGSRDSRIGAASRAAAQKFAASRHQRYGESSFPAANNNNFAHTVRDYTGISTGGSSGLWWLDEDRLDSVPIDASPYNEPLRWY